MKKKSVYLAAAVLGLAIAFLAGHWSGSPPGTETGPPATASQIPAPSVDSSSMSPGTVQIGPEKQQVMGIRVAAVEKTRETHTLRLLGRIVPDETRVYIVKSFVDGWIRDAQGATTGSIVSRNRVLATFYSPELLSAQQSYFYSISATGRSEAGGRGAAQQQVTKSARQFEDNLRNLGMSDTQIEEIGRTLQYVDKVDIRSPVTGLVTVRNVTKGQRIEKGAELFRIVDLRRVWILVDLFENEAAYFKPGAVAKVSLPQQNRKFTATVGATLPQFDPSTRTLKIRLEADNPDNTLRPDMFADVEYPVTFPPAISVPADAVLDSGLRKTVFVDRGEGFFEPRQVETGWRFGNRVEIVKGLEPGERIVVTGNFLVDSESRMEMAAAGMYGTQEKDPVCGVSVSMKKAAKEGRASIHQGKTYYFSSADCKDRFDKDPARYTEKPVEGND